jgi:hypothetical protein
MDWSNLIIQLGISALVLFVGYQIAMKLIDKWSEGDAKRTEYIQEGFKADISAHQEITKTMQVLANQFFRVEGKLDTVLDLTPVRGISRIDPMDAIPQPRRTPSVILEEAASGEKPEDVTPTDRPPPQPLPPPKQPRASSVGGMYGIGSTKSKPRG